ncbi:hypothetical protein [Streptomyces colonosanans]|uniref:Uncharacterized protein n=1 Tax=Streptomyces colonosanans TaxID=1428652 RepID=A0A1S2NYC7_9ACTN|nr:hypothetical protein [Streptomyces colonosanans]OIJ86262.1 hypothetical protein BIV24_26790 [Streptomyces colonosanans]
MTGFIGTQVTAALTPGRGHLAALDGAAPGGSLVPIAVASVIGVVAVLAMARRNLLPRRYLAASFTVFAVALGLVAVAALGSGDGDRGTLAADDTTAAQDPTPPGTPVLRTLALGGKQVGVLVVPGRPGLNLVAVGAEDAQAGTTAGTLRPGERRPGSSQSWIPVVLPKGRSTLRISAGGAAGELPVDTGSGAQAPLAALATADGPECAEVALGALVAGERAPLTACPSDRLAERDATALRATVLFLAARGTRSVGLVSDDSERGRAAAATVRAAAAREGIDVTAPGRATQPLIVTTGWPGATEATLAVEGGRTVAQGVYLAPWLLARSVLTPSAGQLIPLRYTPRRADAMAYVKALTARMPGAYPTGGGYEAWQRVREEEPEPSPRLFAVSVAYVPGGMVAVDGEKRSGGHHHGGGETADWLPSGMISPISGPLKERTNDDPGA